MPAGFLGGMHVAEQSAQLFLEGGRGGLESGGEQSSQCGQRELGFCSRKGLCKLQACCRDFVLGSTLSNHCFKKVGVDAKVLADRQNQQGNTQNVSFD